MRCPRPESQHSSTQKLCPELHLSLSPVFERGKRTALEGDRRPKGPPPLVNGFTLVLGMTGNRRKIFIVI